MALTDLRLKNLFDNYGGGSTSYGAQQQAPVYTTHEPDPYEQPNAWDQIPVNDPRAPNIFAQMQSADMGGAPKPLQNESDWVTRMRELDSPETAATARFDALLNNVPQRQSPGLGRMFTAMATGIGKNDVEAGQKIIDRPYDQDIAAWKEQTTPAYNAANLERQANAQEKTFLGQMVNSELAQRKLDESQRAATARQAGIDTKTENEREIGMIRARAYDFAQRHPDWKWDFSGATIKVMGPDGVPMDTGMPTDKMAEVDKINLQNKGKIEAARVTGENAAGRIQAGGTNIFQDPNTGRRYIPDPDNPGNLKEVQGGPPANIYKPGTAPAPRPAPSTAKERGELEQEAFRNIKNYAPQYRNFIEGDPTTGFTLLPRPEGPDGFKWDKMIKEYINPNYVGPKMDPGPLQPKPYGPGIPNDVPPTPSGTYNPGGGTVQGTYNPGGGTPQGTYNPGGQYPAGGKGVAPTTPPVPPPAPPPNPAETASIIYADEVKIRNKQTGVESAIKKSKLPAALKTGVYEVVK